MSVLSYMSIRLTIRLAYAETEPTHVLVKPRSDASEPSARPTSPCRTPSPTSRLERQGTPTDWSPSNRGSPVSPDKATTITLGGGTRRGDSPEVLPTTPHLPSDTEGHATVDTPINSDTRSLQPPTPAQRIKHSPPPRAASTPRSPPEVIARSSPLPSQQLPVSSPPPPSSSLPLPPSSFPMPANIRKNIQRKVPHPGPPVTRPDSSKNSPVRILVPNSDTSGAGSSQPYSQSLPSQSQQFQRQLPSHPRALPSSLASDFKPPDTSTPKEGNPSGSTRRTSKMFAESFSTPCDIEQQETTSTGERRSIEKPETNIERREGSGSTRPPVPSAPKIEVLEVGTSDTEEETEQLQTTCTTARTEDTQPGKQDMGKRDVGADLEDNHSSVGEVEVHSFPQNDPPRRPSCQPAVSATQHPSLNGQDTDKVSTHPLSQSPKRPMSRSPMHSLFSGSLENVRAVSSYVSVSRTEVQVQEKASPAHVPMHDPEAWKEPSFLARKKGKGKALAAMERDAPSVEMGKERRRSAQPESFVRKRAKVTASEGSGQRQDIDAPAAGKIRSTSPTNTTERTTPSTAFRSSKPRLANLVVDFERIDLGKGVPVPMVDADKDVKRTLLRTGRIRTLGEEDGILYIME